MAAAATAANANSNTYSTSSAFNNNNNGKGGKRGKAKVRRRRKKKKTTEVAQDIVLAHFNAQSLGPKEEIVKMEMDKEGVTLGSFCETCVYKNGGFSDTEGMELRPRGTTWAGTE